ncbi:cupin domain containing protein [Halalkaliarchaeum desulfuricum]|uniref:Cupin domain containing protein n=1 Tax=Halalkaliarchaeum desulfuricum TaxID=2055893 RepID=A0A343TKL0_9EURY|nr:cupin domain-containing protein [Halalkaliarchaeum desulfuricum]AUX09632.1 cupin domain containing protein [Halalkaliarchaeum desulfuricum]
MERITAEELDSTEAVEGVHLSALAAGERMSLQEFRIEPGKDVPTHSHPHEQAGYLVRGELTFVVGEKNGEREEIVLQEGDSYVLPGGEPHAVSNDGDETAVGIDVFAPPRTDPDWKD